MITPYFNIITLFLLFTVVSDFSFATVHKKDLQFTVIERDKKMRAKKIKVSLNDLTSDNSFEGKYFKITLGTSNDAISFHDQEELVHKAATVYHHLTKIREFFINKLNSDRAINQHQMTIRLEIKRIFSAVGKFSHENAGQVFNTATTIPAGAGLPSRAVAPWEMEIWFRPAKPIHISEVTNDENLQDFSRIIGQYRSQIHTMTFQQFLARLITQSSSTPLTSQSIVSTALSTGTTSLVLELIYQFREPLVYATSRKWYWIEAALVPEIIYHEYSHYIFADRLPLTHDNPVVEGVADYFATRVNDHPRVADKISSYSTFAPKRGDQKSPIYNPSFDTPMRADGDFVLAMLWNTLHPVLGKEEALTFAYNMTSHINSSARIRTDLVDAIIQSCWQRCSHPHIERVRFLQILHDMGL